MPKRMEGIALQWLTLSLNIAMITNWHFLLYLHWILFGWDRNVYVFGEWLEYFKSNQIYVINSSFSSRWCFFIKTNKHSFSKLIYSHICRDHFSLYSISIFKENQKWFIFTYWFLMLKLHNLSFPRNID